MNYTQPKLEMLSKCDYIDGIGEYADDVGGWGGEYVDGGGKYVGRADAEVMNMLMDLVNLLPRIICNIRGGNPTIMLKNQVMIWWWISSWSQWLICWRW